MPYLEFQANQVLTAAQVNTYFMNQAVMRFADSAARSSALGTAVQEGMVSYLDDTDAIEKYDGSAWVSISQAGDITSVVAGTALTGGGTAGDVTLDVDQSALSLAGTQVADATPTSVGVVKGLTDATNAALGGDALASNTTGTNNVAIGKNSLASNAGANDNTAVGSSALEDNTTGLSNTAIGRGALLSNTTANNNTAMGLNALSSNTTGEVNVAIGNQNSRFNTTGDDNVSLGFSNLENNTTGSSNIAIGFKCLDAGETNRNIAIGREAMANFDDSPSAYNVAIGWTSLFNNSLGIENVALGRSTGFQLTTGDSNTFIGNQAGDSITTGNNNTVIGNAAAASSATVSNEITLGNSSITNLRCNDTSISGLSDARDKTNIQDSPLGLDLIQRLRPVTFDWDRRDGSMAGMKDVGFIAQEVIEVEDNLDIHRTLRMSSRENEDKYEVAPARLIPVLTKAIQQLSEQNAELKARLDKLEGK